MGRHCRDDAWVWPMGSEGRGPMASQQNQNDGGGDRTRAVWAVYGPCDQSLCQCYDGLCDAWGLGWEGASPQTAVQSARGGARGVMLP